MLAPHPGRDDGLLAIHLGLAKEDEAAMPVEADVADVIDLVLVVFGTPPENELDATDLHHAVECRAAIDLDFLFRMATGMEAEGEELATVAFLASPAVSQIVLGFEHRSDGGEDLFLLGLDRNERQRCQLLVADNLHLFKPFRCEMYPPKS